MNKRIHAARGFSRLVRLATAVMAGALLLAAFAGEALAYVPEKPDGSLETARGTICKQYYTYQGYGYLNVFYLKTKTASKAVPSLVSATKLASIAKKHKKRHKRAARIATVKKRGGGILVYFSKPGAVKLRYTWKGVAHSVVLKAFAYTNPLKRFSVGSANLAKRYARGNTYTATAKGTISVVPAAGWKLLSITGSVNHGWSYPRKLRNKAPVPDAVTDICLTLRRTSNGARQEIYFHRFT